MRRSGSLRGSSSQSVATMGPIDTLELSRCAARVSRPAGDAKRTAQARPGYTQAMIGFLLAGLIIGLPARLLLPGRQKIGLLWTLALGVIGSLIGGTIANALRSGSIWELNFVGFVCAVGASVIVLAVAERSGMLTAGDRRRGDLPPRV